MGSGWFGLSGQALETPEYMNAYLNGMQFVLLALEGHLEAFDGDEQDAIREFLDEYHEIAMRMRERARLGVSP